jgi:hypothetical protein
MSVAPDLAVASSFGGPRGCHRNTIEQFFGHLLGQVAFAAEGEKVARWVEGLCVELIPPGVSGEFFRWGRMGTWDRSHRCGIQMS